MTFDIRRPHRDDEAATLRILVAAFGDDPAFRAVLPDDGDRALGLRALFKVALRGAGPGARVAVEGARVVGAATWFPSERSAHSFSQSLRALPTMAGLTLRLGGRIRELARFGGAIDAAFPKEPVRYLQMLGVAPDAQGRGVGAALIRDGLAQADARGEPVYLETSNAANVPIYEHYGFEVLPGSPAPIRPGLPVMWRMQRPSQHTGDRAETE